MELKQQQQQQQDAQKIFNTHIWKNSWLETPLSLYCKWQTWKNHFIAIPFVKIVECISF